MKQSRNCWRKDWVKRLSDNRASQTKIPARDILAHLPEVFGVSEAEKYVGHPTQWLTRASSSGLIRRLQRGTYWNSFRYPDLSFPYLACQIKRAPSYISCEWALHARGVLLQRPFTCTVLTLSTAVGRERSIQLMGEAIEFSHISAKLFWGYESVEGYFLATAEKAYLDTLHYGRNPDQWGELEKGMLDWQVLHTMAEKFPLRVSKQLAAIMKRLF